MKVFINYGVGITSINEEKTEWCCEEFKNWGHKRKIIDNVGDEPESIFNWDKLEFQKVNDGIMLGMGGFGDRFWGDKINVCPFCGTKIERLKFNINGDDFNGSRKKLIKLMER